MGIYAAINALLSSGGSTTYLDNQILTDIGTLLSSVISWITGNSLIMLFFTISLVGTGIGLFKRLRGSVGRS